MLVLRTQTVSVVSPIDSGRYEYRTNVFCRSYESLTTLRLWRKSFSRRLIEDSQIPHTSPIVWLCADHCGINRGGAPHC